MLSTLLLLVYQSSVLSLHLSSLNCKGIFWLQTKHNRSTFHPFFNKCITLGFCAFFKAPFLVLGEAKGAHPATAGETISNSVPNSGGAP